MKKFYLILLTILTVFFLVSCSSDSEEESLPQEEEQTNPMEAEQPVQKEPEKPIHKKEDNNSLGQLEVHYIDVGQADSTLMQFSDKDANYAILIDAGDFTGDEVVPYLKANRIEKINIAVATHPDADHIGQLDQVINEMEVEEVWMSGNMSSSDTFTRVLNAIEKNDVVYTEPRMGEKYEIGPLQIEVLYPKEISGDANEESLSFRFSYGDVDFIFTGDAEKENELEMIQSGTNLEAEFLQLGHHGSSTSTSKEFLQAVNPKVAIYSAGENNSYGHPSEEVVSLVKNLGIELYGTDVHGTIIVATDGEKYQIVTKDTGTIPSPREDNKRTENEKPPAISNESCININTASAEEIEKIIHIGPERAEDLIELRPFQSLDDLTRIKGIGPARIKEIRQEGLACM